MIILIIKGSINRGRNMGMGGFSGVMGLVMKASFRIMKFRGKGNKNGLHFLLLLEILGVMGGIMKGNGCKGKCMEEGFIIGRMEGNMKAIIRWIKRKDKACLVGPMGGSMKASGLMESSMGLAILLIRIRRLRRGDGRMGRGWNGLKIKKINERNE